jgi:hypothetical protein
MAMAMFCVCCTLLLLFTPVPLGKVLPTVLAVSVLEGDMGSGLSAGNALGKS